MAGDVTITKVRNTPPLLSTITPALGKVAPTPSARNVSSELNGECVNGRSAPENNPDLVLWDKMKSLWLAQLKGDATVGDYKTKLSISREAADKLRDVLAEELFRYKAATVGKGRDGKWGGLINHIGITRTTADRLVMRWDRRLNPKKYADKKYKPLDGVAFRKLLDQVVKQLAPRLQDLPTTTAFIEKLRNRLEAKCDSVDRSEVAGSAPQIE